MSAVPRTYGEVEGLITMLQVACEDAYVNSTLQEILSLPDAQRKVFVHKLVERMRMNAAPHDFVEAFLCLLDDSVAEMAYQVIFKCERRAGNGL